MKIGRLDINTENGEVKVNNHFVNLSGKEYGILLALAQRHGTGAVMNKYDLMNTLYGGRREPQIKIITVFMVRLRTKLARCDGADLIETRKRGYALNA